MSTTTTTQLISKAIEMAGANTSAQFCIANAQAMVNANNELAARRWAIRSLQYSVGLFHPVFQDLKIN